MPKINIVMATVLTVAALAWTSSPEEIRLAHGCPAEASAQPRAVSLPAGQPVQNKEPDGQQSDQLTSSPFADAVGVWHMSDLCNSNAGTSDSTEYGLATHGGVRVGVALTGAEQEASTQRGGDGRVAVFDGDGWLSTARATGGVALAPDAFTACVRIRADRAGGVLYTSQFALIIHGDGLLVAHLGVASGPSKLYREVLLGKIEFGSWHDVIVRFAAGRLELYCDGGLVNRVAIKEPLTAIFAGPSTIGAWRLDQPPLPEFPMEIVNGVFQRLFHGAIDHSAFWNRALGDAEIARLSGESALHVDKPDPAMQRALNSYNSFYDASRAKDVAACRELGLRMRRYLARDPKRPIYHLTAPMGFIQDPCGAFYRDGQYHVFSLRNILVTLSCTHLDHYVSEDLIHWRDMPVACWADSDYDVYGIWLTNNFVDDDGVPTMIYTAHGMQGKIGVLARSTDNLASYQDKRAVITNRIHHDGHTWKEGDRWVTITTDQYFGSRPGARADRIVALTSRDLEHWTEQGEVFSVSKHANPQDSTQRWGLTEFPYIVPFGDKHALITGNRPVVYWVGTFDQEQLVFTPDEPDYKLLDYGNPVHCCNPLIVDDKGPGGSPRRIILAEHGHARGAVGAVPWHGVHVLPRVLTVDGTRLLQEPVVEVESLRGRHYSQEDVRIAPGARGLSEKAKGDALEIVCDFEPGDATRIGLKVRVSDDGKSFTSIFYDVASGNFGVTGNIIASPYREQGQGPAYLRRGEPVRMRAFLDKCLLEVFVNGHTCSMVFDTDPNALGVDLFSEGGTSTARSLDIWGMRSMSPAAD